MFKDRIITEDMLDKAYKASRLKDGRWFSRIPVAYDQETKKYKYKTIYGKNQKDVWLYKIFLIYHLDKNEVA